MVDYTEFAIEILQLHPKGLNVDTLVKEILLKYPNIPLTPEDLSNKLSRKFASEFNKNKRKSIFQRVSNNRGGINKRHVGSKDNEIKKHEYRVGLTPSDVKSYVTRGHQVYMETEAGLDAGFEFMPAGFELDFQPGRRPGRPFEIG